MGTQFHKVEMQVIDTHHFLKIIHPKRIRGKLLDPVLGRNLLELRQYSNFIAG
jgi:hypothetical protein